MQLLSSPIWLLTSAVLLSSLLQAVAGVVVDFGSAFACFKSYNTDYNASIALTNVFWDDNDYGLQRYRIRFRSEKLGQNYGQDFLTRIRCHDGGGITNNWQCWYDDTANYWYFDINELTGEVGRNCVMQGVQDVTGQQPLTIFKD